LADLVFVPVRCGQLRDSLDRGMLLGVHIGFVDRKIINPTPGRETLFRPRSACSAISRKLAAERRDIDACNQVANQRKDPLPNLNSDRHRMRSFLIFAGLD